MPEYAPRRVSPQRVERFVSSAFQRVGVSPSEADLAAAMRLDVDLHGIDSHGVLSLHG